MLWGLCHRFLSAAFWIHRASPWVLPLCMTFLPPQQSYRHRTVCLVQSWLFSFISPKKVKFDLRHCSLHWNSWNKPPPIRFCQVCCRVGSLRQMDGMDSKDIIISYTPQLYSLGYICQYPTPTESVSHFFTPKISTTEDTQKINHITWKWQIQLGLKKQKTSPKRQWIQPSCAAWLVQRYLYHYHLDWETNGDCWDMLNQAAALKHECSKMFLLLYSLRKDAVCNSGRQSLLIFTDLQVKRNAVLFNISYIVFITICSLAQYQPQMIVEFVMTDKVEISLAIKVEYSGTRTAGSKCFLNALLLNVVMHSLHHLW